MKTTVRRITVAEPANSGEVYGTPVHETEVWHIGLVLEPEGLVVVDATKEVVTKPDAAVTKVQPVTKGRPRRYESPAARQAAYRRRKA